MTDDEERLLEPDRWGIHHHWVDAFERVTAVDDNTVRRLRDAIGTPAPDLEATAPIVTRPGRELRLGHRALEVECEDGTVRVVDDALPDDFPLGYHRLRTPGGGRRLIVSPGRCWLPGDRTWGWTVQLYATRSRRSWGIGDLADLRSLREWSADLGAGFLLVNPLHAAAPTLPQEPSPYLPATRRFRNPLYLRVEEVPGASLVDLERWSASATAYDVDEPIDRDRVWQLKREALAEIFAKAGGGADFATWRERQGPALGEFGTWCALADEYGADWRTWDAGLQQPASAAVRDFATAHATQVDFYCWLQWVLDVQLRHASGDLKVIQDLPIGVSGGGADAWARQDTLAIGAKVGAPPDIFNAAGQDWGSPPLIPWRLRAAGYEPFIESIRATMAGGGGIRIDHVMGLFRLWWVPEGAAPRDGAYVRYPSEDLLDIVALESHRAGSLVVGEDLGTVEPGVREALAERGVLSYRLLWFEDDEPADWPQSSLAAVTTHDLPTVAGLWTGADVAEQAEHVDIPTTDLEQGRQEMLGRWTKRAGVDPAESAVPAAEAVVAAHRLLATAPSAMLSATLEDGVAVERRPNLPGVTARDNWNLPLPVSIEDLPQHPTVAAVADALARGAGEDG